MAGPLPQPTAARLVALLANGIPGLQATRLRVAVARLPQERLATGAAGGRAAVVVAADRLRLARPTEMAARADWAGRSMTPPLPQQVAAG